MYKIKLNKTVLKNHIQYDCWKYLAGILITALMWSMIVSATAPRTPAEKKVDIYLVGGFMFDEGAQELEERILDDFPDLLEVNLYSIMLSGEWDYVGRQKFATMLYSHMGDIFILSTEEFESLAKEGVLLPLDDQDQLKSYLDEELLAKGTTDTHEDSTKRLYGIPLYESDLFKNTFDTSDAVMGVMVYSGNIPYALEVAEWILEKGNN